VTEPGATPPTRLARRLGLGDAVVVGLGSMIGAGVFAAIGPAAAAAGSGLLIGLALAVYAAVALSALLAVGPDQLAASDAPLAAAVRAGRLDWLTPAVRVGGTVAALGVLLALIAGVSRTAFAMAADGEVPRGLAAVHPVHQVPPRAELTVGALVVVVVALVDLRGAIGFSSFAVLAYYAIANASAWTLPRRQRRWPRALAAAGLVGCAALVLTLPAASVLAGACVLAVGAVIWWLRHDRSRGRSSRRRLRPPPPDRA
jgi:APA family basic amino acid/polyamine antiporter